MWRYIHDRPMMYVYPKEHPLPTLLLIREPRVVTAILRSWRDHSRIELLGGDSITIRHEFYHLEDEHGTRYDWNTIQV